MILEHYPERERLQALQEKNKNGHILLVQALGFFQEIKEFTKRFKNQLVNDQGVSYEKLLSDAKATLESFKMILELYPETERLQVVNHERINFRRLLFNAAAYPELLEVILSLLTPEQRILAFQTIDRTGESLLFEAAFYPNPSK